jgi:hypothetical protein
MEHISIHNSLDYAMTGWFTVWFLASVVCQIPTRLARVINRYDLFRLVPRWSFFAPNPGHTDYHILYRDSAAGTPISAWRELPVPGRTLLAMFWNPDKRLRKCLVDCTQQIVATAAATRTADHMAISIPYLLLLNIVMRQCVNPGVASRQFVIAQSYGFHPARKPEVLVRSEFHVVSVH